MQFNQSVQKPHRPVTGLQTTPCHVAPYHVQQLKIFRIFGLLFAMVPCLHQLKVYIKRKLRVWRAQKCNFLVSAKTAPTGTGQQTTPCLAAPYWAKQQKFSKLSGLPVAMVPCLHHCNVYIKRKLRVWRAQKCNFLVSAKTTPTGTACKLPRIMQRRIGQQ